jgi:cytochrome bd-type quinol oxidase subunit 2
MTPLTARLLPLTGALAALVFVGAVAGFGVALSGYSQVWHPVAVLGAKGVPHALGFNLLGFVLTGVLAAVAALDLRHRLPADAGWPARVGTQLLLLSAMGFIALGVLPLDPDDLHNEASSLHATAWLLWWVAFVPGAALFAFGMRGRSRWRPVVTASIVAAAVVLFSALIAVALMPAGIAQRLGYAAWLGWLCVASRAGR